MAQCTLHGQRQRGGGGYNLSLQETAESIEAVLLDERSTSGIVMRPAPWLQAAAVLLNRGHTLTTALTEDGLSLVSDTFR